MSKLNNFQEAEQRVLCLEHPGAAAFILFGMLYASSCIQIFELAICSEMAPLIVIVLNECVCVVLSLFPTINKTILMVFLYLYLADICSRIECATTCSIHSECLRFDCFNCDTHKWDD